MILKNFIFSPNKYLFCNYSLKFENFASHILSFLTILICLVLIVEPVFAAIGNENILTGISEKYQKSASEWGPVLLKYAERLFWSIAVIGMVYQFGTGFLKGEIGDVRSFFASFMGYCLFLGFFLWLLKNGPEFAKTILNSMVEIAEKATNSSTSDASALVDTAFAVFDKVVAGASITSPILAFGSILLGTIILITMILIAANLTIEYCAAWVLLYAGCFFLGFGGSKWTSDMAISYYKSVLSTGVRIMAMLMMIGIGSAIVTEHTNKMAEPTSRDLATLLAITIVFFALINKVPNILANLVGGGQGAGNLGFGSMMAAAGMMGAAGSFATGTLGGAVGALAARGGSAIKNSMASVASEATGSAMSAMASTATSAASGGSSAGEGLSGVLSGQTPFATKVSSESFSGGRSVAPSMSYGSNSGSGGVLSAGGEGSPSRGDRPNLLNSSRAGLEGNPSSSNSLSNSPGGSGAAEGSPGRSPNHITGTRENPESLNNPEAVHANGHPSNTLEHAAGTGSQDPDQDNQQDKAQDVTQRQQGRHSGKTTADYLAQAVRDFGNDLER